MRFVVINNEYSINLDFISKIECSIVDKDLINVIINVDNIKLHLEITNAKELIQEKYASIITHCIIMSYNLISEQIIDLTDYIDVLNDVLSRYNISDSEPKFKIL